MHIPPKERGEHPGKEHAHGSVVVVVAGGGTPWEEEAQGAGSSKQEREF